MKKFFVLIRPNRGGKKKTKMGDRYYIVPHLISIGAICAGMAAVKYALLGRFSHAMMALLLATILDMLDGRIARLLKSCSSFGEQLDSLADFCNFGVAPSFIMYIFYGQSPMLWWCCLFYTTCAALRLARFNSTPVNNYYFTGVPTTISALISTLPISMFLSFGNHSLIFGMLMLIISGGLMISSIPTLSFKKLHLPTKYLMPTLAGSAGLIGFIIYLPWYVLSLTVLVYLIIIPIYASSKYRSLKNMPSPKFESKPMERDRVVNFKD